MELKSTQEDLKLLHLQKKNHIVRLASNKCISAKQIKKYIGTSASVRTVGNYMNASSILKYRKLKTKPNLKNEHKNARLEFEKKYMT